MQYNANGEKLYTSVEVSAIIESSRHNVTKYCNNGRFSGAFKIGKGRNSSWLIPESDVEYFLYSRDDSKRPKK